MWRMRVWNGGEWGFGIDKIILLYAVSRHFERLHIMLFLFQKSASFSDEQKNFNEEAALNNTNLSTTQNATTISSSAFPSEIFPSNLEKPKDKSELESQKKKHSYCEIKYCSGQSSTKKYSVPTANSRIAEIKTDKYLSHEPEQTSISIFSARIYVKKLSDWRLIIIVVNKLFHYLASSAARVARDIPFHPFQPNKRRKCCKICGPIGTADRAHIADRRQGHIQGRYTRNSIADFTI